MAISDVYTSTTPVLLKESETHEASIAGRKPVELEKVYLLFLLQWKPDHGT